jgi:hypothetical protein
MVLHFYPLLVTLSHVRVRAEIGLGPIVWVLLSEIYPLSGVFV